MFKQIFVLLLLSVLIILFMPYAHQVIEWIVNAHTWVLSILKDVFSGGNVGDLTRNLLALLAVPVGVAMIPVLLYYVIKRQWFPYFMQIVWVTWLLETAALLLTA
jgi:hypothetical protein